MAGASVMRFSVCSWTFGDTPIEKVFDRVSSAGYTCIDLTATVDAYNWSEVARLAGEFSLEISGLTCDSGWPAEDHDLANGNPLNRQKAIDWFKRQLECVRIVGGDYLIVVPSAVGKFWSMGRDASEDWKWAVESVRNLTETAADAGVTLVIEPLNRYESCIVNSADDALRFVNAVNHPNVRALLDTYHMNIEESDMQKAFITLQNELEVVHFADSNRQALGRGHIDFQPVVSGMKQIGFDKTIVLECTAPGPNPFKADKGEMTMEVMSQCAADSLVKLREWFT
jgi:D-psicose/D-tagatose/L-ribulose 3-epimerase